MSAACIHLAEAMYAGEDCGFALHDALLEQGAAALAEHFAAGGRHWRGCRALAVILAKGGAVLPTTRCGQAFQPADVKRLVLSGAADAVVADAFYHLPTSLNLESAATSYFAVAGFICHHRPRLASRLLRLPIDCLVQLGVERPEQVLRFVRFEIEQAPAHVTEDAGPEGLSWLTVELPQLTALIWSCWRTACGDILPIDRANDLLQPSDGSEHPALWTTWKPAT